MAADHDAVLSYTSDPEVTRLMYSGPWDAADTRAYLGRMLESQGALPRLTWELAVVERDQGLVIGSWDLTMEDQREADLGYILGRPWWGRGYATEAAAAMVHAGFEQLALERVFAMCELSHKGSQRVLEKAGLRPKTIVKAAREAKGRWWDMWLYELLRHEWRSSPPR